MLQVNKFTVALVLGLGLVSIAASQDGLLTLKHDNKSLKKGLTNEGGGQSIRSSIGF